MGIQAEQVADLVRHRVAQNLGSHGPPISLPLGGGRNLFAIEALDSVVAHI